MKAILKISSSAVSLKENAAAFSFAFINDENNIVLQSDNYKTKDSAKKGIRAVKTHSIQQARYILEESSNGMFFFKLKSSNGIVVATSAMFSTEESRQDAMNQLAGLAPECVVEEQLVG